MEPDLARALCPRNTRARSDTTHRGEPNMTDRYTPELAALIGEQLAQA